MCGIAGFSGSLSDGERLMSGAASSLLHRGPDSDGLFSASEGRLWLAHTRLAIHDLSPTGHQPMLSADGSVAIVFNGEIYNFTELRSELEAAGHVFSGHSDTEVRLELYLANRDSPDLASVLRRLNGIFAFELWDSTSLLLWLVRDAYGVKPLLLPISRGCIASS